MYRLLLLITCSGAINVGCAEIECEGKAADAVCTNDDRPATLEYVVHTVLRPNCANAQCHSSLKNTDDYRFDSIEHAQESIVKLHDPADPMDDEQIVFPGDPDSSLLYQVLIRPSNFDFDAPRMPYDQPLPGPDIALVKRWIAEGADGLVVP
jgi:hypothetical protein